MEIIGRFDFDKIKALSTKDIKYTTHPALFSDFISYQPTLEGLDKMIEERKTHKAPRELLCHVLKKQYASIGILDGTIIETINLLLSNLTFTVVTAHQPILFTGPAYYFYKIMSTIHLTKKMKKRHPELEFVPVFINGAEDHDFDEIKRMYIHGKEIQWDTNQSGPVGRFHTQGLHQSVDKLSDIIGTSEKGLSITSLFKKALEESDSYAQFVLRINHSFFGDKGLLNLNMDEPQLKRAFIPILKDELLHQTSIKLIQETQAVLEDTVGFKPQAHARDINIFYLGNGGRHRITKEDNHYAIQDTDLVFNENEILKELEDNPENFSPNVILRPLYQESILPNIAYIGGGGEISYWLERKNQFKHYNIPMPILLRRNSYTFLPSHVEKNISKLGLKLEDFLHSLSYIHTLYLNKNVQEDFTMDEQKLVIQDALQKIAQKALHWDKSLEGFIVSEGTKINKIIEHVETKIVRSLKSQQETNINQINNIKEKYFDDNQLQERKESFLTFINQCHEGYQLIDKMIDISDPLGVEFIFIRI